jgi:hypothetical protein
MHGIHILYITILNRIVLFSLGFVTDGEFNSLRTKGEKRMIHVVELIRDARNSVSSKSGKKLLKLLERTEGIQYM